MERAGAVWRRRIRSRAKTHLLLLLRRHLVRGRPCLRAFLYLLSLGLGRPLTDSNSRRGLRTGMEIRGLPHPGWYIMTLCQPGEEQWLLRRSRRPRVRGFQVLLVPCLQSPQEEGQELCARELQAAFPSLRARALPPPHRQRDETSRFLTSGIGVADWQHWLRRNRKPRSSRPRTSLKGICMLHPLRPLGSP